MKNHASNQRELDKMIKIKEDKISLGNGCFDITCDATFVEFTGSEDTTVNLVGNYQLTNHSDQSYKTYVFLPCFLSFNNVKITAHRKTELVFLTFEELKETLSGWRNVQFDRDKFDVIAQDIEIDAAVSEFKETIEDANVWLHRNIDLLN